MDKLAYYATVQMHEAKWTDKEGSTVTFKLPMGAQRDDQRNPFYYYTKRRKGRAGTRFIMVCVDQKLKQTIYEDEVMLCGWNDSQTNGHTVKFWLCADTLGHPFEGFERHEPERFYISLVELDDNNESIDQAVRERVERVNTKPSERVSYIAAMLCKNEGFWTYVLELTAMTEQDCKAMGITDLEDYCRQWMLDQLNINSRSWLDKDEESAKQFHEKIRRPFLHWQGEDY
jgi:hypothetical protein